MDEQPPTRGALPHLQQGADAAPRGLLGSEAAWIPRRAGAAVGTGEWEAEQGQAGGRRGRDTPKGFIHPAGTPQQGSKSGRGAVPRTRWTGGPSAASPQMSQRHGAVVGGENVLGRRPGALDAEPTGPSSPGGQESPHGLAAGRGNHVCLCKGRKAASTGLLFLPHGPRPHPGVLRAPKGQALLPSPRGPAVLFPGWPQRVTDRAAQGRRPGYGVAGLCPPGSGVPHLPSAWDPPPRPRACPRPWPPQL